MVVPQECRLAVKVLPKASKNEITGWENGELKVRLRAVPEKGKANQALIAFMAEALDISPSAISLLRGETSRHKLLLIRGLEYLEVEKRLLLDSK